MLVRAEGRSIPASSPAAMLLHRYLTALERRDAAGAASLFADEAVIKTPCMPEPGPKAITGRAAFESILQWGFDKAFKRLAWSELEVHSTDDPTLAIAIAKSDIELYDGRSYSNDYVFCARVRDGKIVEETEYFDTTRAAKAFEGFV